MNYYDRYASLRSARAVGAAEERDAIVRALRWGASRAGRDAAFKRVTCDEFEAQRLAYVAEALRQTADDIERGQHHRMVMSIPPERDPRGGEE